MCNSVLCKIQMGPGGASGILQTVRDWGVVSNNKNLSCSTNEFIAFVFIVYLTSK